jgi:Tfp pilus assembly protein PilF
LAGETPAPSAVVKKAEDLPKRTPKPATCVAYGTMQEGQANDDKLPPATRQSLQDQARIAYQQAIKIDSGYMPAYLSLAHLYLAQDDYPRAFDTYHKALQKQPKAAEVWHALGMCHARKREWEPALTALKKAADLDIENRQYSRDLGLCFARAGRSDEAVLSLAKVMNQGEANYNVARMLHHLQRDDESKCYLQRALQVKPDLTAAREMLAQLENPGSSPAANPVVTVGFEEERHVPSIR